jgi:hypothetical protein
MQARTKPPIAPYFIRGDKVTVVTNNLCLRGQPNRKIRDGELGHFSVEVQIGKHYHKLRVPTIFRSHLVFHVNNTRPCSTTSLRLVVSTTTREDDDALFDVAHIYDVCIEPLTCRREKYLLFLTHLSEHCACMAPVERDVPTKALQYFLETPQ